MSSATGAAYGAANATPGTEWRGPWEGGSRHCGGSMRWRPLELVAMVLGFMVFWPVGLAILGWKMCMKGWNRQTDFMAYAAERWRTAARGFDRSARGERWRPFTTGNAAFDDWKSAEMARLEEERRKLDEAHREFAEFLDNLRRARDREEFDSFMSQRRRPPYEPPPAPQPHSPAA